MTGGLARAGASPAAGAAGGKPATPQPAVAATTPAPETARPILTVERDVVQLDPLWAGKPIQPEWVIRNTGQAPLSIRIKGG
jgi:hypothetical protein